MKLLKTLPDQVPTLADFSYPSAWTQLDQGVTVHSIDVGVGPVVLLMHGQPTWSYLYRSMVDPLVRAGYRVVSPDLVGFGWSDKPTEVSDHTYERHVAWMDEWLRRSDLDGVTMFAQDWGGLIGLRLLADEPDRFARVAVANTGLPTGDRPMPDAFSQWKEFVRTTPTFDAGRVVQGGTVRTLTPAEVAAYNAPFPTPEHQAGPRAMPALVPVTSDDPSAEPNRQAWSRLTSWKRPLLTLFSDNDPITGGGDRVFRKLVPGAEGQPHQVTRAAGHFLQEDAGSFLAETLVAWMS